MLRLSSRAGLTGLTLAAMTAGCGPSTIRVVGVMQQSSEMRPLPNVPVGAYKDLRVFVKAAASEASAYGSADCGFTPLAGTSEGQDLKNAACVPPDAQNVAIGIVRTRFRSYGVQVVRDATEPYDYRVDVSVTGEAPKQPDRTLAKAVATLAFSLNTAATGGTLMSSVNLDGARAAFAQVANDCAFKNADLSQFVGWARQPMTPDFDVQALANDAVDSVLRCDDLARFVMDARTRFPK
jgi:hypothetical protein